MPDPNLAAILAALPLLRFVPAAEAPPAPCYVIVYDGDWALAHRHRSDEGRWSLDEGSLIDDPLFCAALPPAPGRSPREVKSLAGWITDLIEDGDYAEAAKLIDELADAVRAARDGPKPR